MRLSPRVVIVAAILAAFSAAAPARLVEVQRWVPAKAVDGKGREASRDMMVTIYYDDDLPQPYPALVLGHGRAASSKGRAALGRAQYPEASRWFAGLGFMVAVPTRIGYGVTGGPDIEDTGGCASKVYPPGYVASAAQTLTALEYLRSWKEVAKDRAVIVGQSYGGATAITVAAMNTPGVQATINFAGGGGGDPKGHPGKPCAPDRLRQMFADYGKTARIPTLWIYSENDQYMGPTHPKEWFDAFKAAGGKGEFKQFPPNGADGHHLFLQAPEWWKPKVLEFLRANGYPGIEPKKDR